MYGGLHWDRGDCVAATAGAACLGIAGGGMARVGGALDEGAALVADATTLAIGVSATGTGFVAACAACELPGDGEGATLAETVAAGAVPVIADMVRATIPPTDARPAKARPMSHSRCEGTPAGRPNLRSLEIGREVVPPASDGGGFIGAVPRARASPEYPSPVASTIGDCEGTSICRCAEVSSLNRARSA